MTIIYLSRQALTHTQTYIYIYMYVCIHALPKEKSLVFSFKIMFDGDSFIK